MNNVKTTPAGTTEPRVSTKNEVAKKAPVQISEPEADPQRAALYQALFLLDGATSVSILHQAFAWLASAESNRNRTPDQRQMATDLLDYIRRQVHHMALEEVARSFQHMELD